jgi:hypothetical protein
MTSRAPAAIVSSYMRPSMPVIEAPHGEGVGSLLAAKGGGCDLDTDAYDSMANQLKEVPTMDIYEPPGRRTRRAGRA